MFFVVVVNFYLELNFKLQKTKSSVAPAKQPSSQAQAFPKCRVKSWQLLLGLHSLLCTQGFLHRVRQLLRHQRHTSRCQLQASQVPL